MQGNASGLDEPERALQQKCFACCESISTTFSVAASSRAAQQLSTQVLKRPYRANTAYQAADSALQVPGLPLFSLSSCPSASAQTSQSVRKFGCDPAKFSKRQVLDIGFSNLQSCQAAASEHQLAAQLCQAGARQRPHKQSRPQWCSTRMRAGCGHMLSCKLWWGRAA